MQKSSEWAKEKPRPEITAPEYGLLAEQTEKGYLCNGHL